MKIVARGTLHRGEVGSNRAVGTFPMVAGLSNGRVLATYKVGPNKDSDLATVELCWSEDLGQSWTEPTTLEVPRIEGKKGALWTAYPTQLASGRLVLISMWVDRESFPGSTLFHPETEGCLPMTVLRSESDGGGRNWSPWQVIPTPAELGPPSVTSPLMELAGGRLALSVETNKPYLDASKWYQRVVYLYSEDQGQSWSAPHTVSQDPTGRMFNWDQRAGVAPDGRIVTFTWYFDSQTATYLNIRRRISRDEGRSWTDPEDLGFRDQAATPAILPDGRTVLARVDRFGTQSIRARLAPIHRRRILRRDRGRDLRPLRRPEEPSLRRRDHGGHTRGHGPLDLRPALCHRLVQRGGAAGLLCGAQPTDGRGVGPLVLLRIFIGPGGRVSLTRAVPSGSESA